MSHHSRSAHLGSSLSCVDILVTLYFEILNLDREKFESFKRDRFILSKGHAGASLYAVLAFKDFINIALLDTYCQPGSILEDHPGPGIQQGGEAATGS